jgi:hypothetical protein
MADYLPRLLKSYAFVEEALTRQGSRLARSDAERLLKERADIFAEIMAHTSSDSLITVAQLRFILQNFQRWAHEPEMLQYVLRLSLRHLARIAEAQVSARTKEPRGPAVRRRPGVALTADSFRCFDCMSDRASVFDRSYRYIYTNTANARFHNQDASDFVGRPSWQVAGKRYFEEVSRGLMDAALRGEATSNFLRNPNRQGAVHSVTFDPVHDEKGKIVAVLLVSKEVTHLSIPEDQILGF